MTEPIKIKAHFRDVPEETYVRFWAVGDPFPDFGEDCGVDTETELITDEEPVPELVVLGVYNPKDNTTYISYKKDAIEFMQQLCHVDTKQFYFNVGFDEQVLTKAAGTQALTFALDNNNVRDMQVRAQLCCIADIGIVPGYSYSLAGCSEKYLNLKMEKGDIEDAAAPRYTFKRDREITTEQAIYLAYDCMTTWQLGKVLPEQKPEVAHTKGAVALAHMTTNGMPVDMFVFDALRAKLLADREQYKQALMSFGFPDPDAKEVAEAERKNFFTQYGSLLRCAELTSGLATETVTDEDGETTSSTKMPSKSQLHKFLIYAQEACEQGADKQTLAEYAKYLFEEDNGAMRKAHKEAGQALIAQYNLESFYSSRKSLVLQSLVGRVIEGLNKGLSFADSMAFATDYLDTHPEWLSSEKPVGPRKFFQAHVQRVISQNPKLQLKTTEKSGEFQLTKQDKWRLDDLDIKDKFLDAYVDFNHCGKYLSTYLNTDNIKPDGRMHGRYTCILRTGRTSQTAPNLCLFGGSKTHRIAGNPNGRSRGQSAAKPGKEDNGGFRDYRKALAE